MTKRRSFLGALLLTAGALPGCARKIRANRPCVDARGHSADLAEDRGASPTLPAVGVRVKRLLSLRQQCAIHQSQRPIVKGMANGDERSVPDWVANFAKGLPHTQAGEVEAGKYETLLSALESGKSEDFAKLARGSGRTLVNPQAAFAFHLEGADSRTFACPPAPAFSSPEAAAEVVELYWQAVARDVPFAEYTDSPVIRSAADELGRLSGYMGPRSDGKVSADLIFRGPAHGEQMGPYLSQFLWKPVPCGSGLMEQRYRSPRKGADYLQTYSEWLQIQTGVPPWRPTAFEQEYRYITTGRDLAEYVHFDFLYQAFLNAALIMENQGPENLLNTTYYLGETNPYKHSKTQQGFVTFGCAHIADWLGRVVTAAMKAAWYQKWLVHRRLRPEEFGGRVHQAKAASMDYPIHKDLLNSAAVQEVFSRQGSYLLPQSYAEGCPLHPAYPAGHATVAGACATILKAYFDESMVLADCVVPTPDGRSLEPYRGPALTAKGEIEKLAFNIPMGRDWAGIHYRSDGTAGLRLGEEVAITVMEDLVNTLTEDFDGFRFTRFDGKPVHITKMM